MAVVIIGGTTAAGKSRLAIEIAEEVGAVVVSADAMTVYRGLDIGTAKPTAEEQERVPHLGIDVRDIDGSFSVSDFVDTFEAAFKAHEHVLVVGGTPFYLSALVRPLAPMPEADPELRAELEELENPHAKLVELDPVTASRLHPNDRLRVIRGLEVSILAGEPMSELHARSSRTPTVDAKTVWLDHDDLDGRIETRLQDMLSEGYVDEVRNVLANNWPRDAKPLRSFSYRHIIEHADGHLELDEAVRRTARDTRRFARKQRTWARGLGWKAQTADDAKGTAKAAFLES